MRLLWIGGGALVGFLSIMALATWFAPKVPTVLEMPPPQTELRCTQQRTAEQEQIDDGSTTLTQLYVWHCEPEVGPTFVTNDAKAPPRTTNDAELLAQQQVVHWAVWGVAFSGLGWLAVFGSLIAARQQTIATREIGENQSKCYLNVEECSVRLSGIVPVDLPDAERMNVAEDATVEIKVRIKNHGQTPAEKYTWRPRQMLVGAVLPAPEVEWALAEHKCEPIDASDVRTSAARYLAPLADREDSTSYGFRLRYIDLIAAEAPTNPQGLLVQIVISVCRMDVFGKVEWNNFGFGGHLQIGSLHKWKPLGSTGFTNLKTQAELEADIRAATPGN